MDIDILETAKAWPALWRRMAGETDPRKLAMLREIVLHMVGEYIGDTPMVMETLVAEPTYRYWGLAPRRAPRNRAEVIATYDFSATVRQNMAIERVLVDGDHVFTEGRLQLSVDASRIEEMAGAEAAKDLDHATQHLVEIQLAIVWPFAPDGKLLGEEIYFGSKPQVIRPVGADEALYAGPALL